MTRKTSQICVVLLTVFELGSLVSWNLESDALPIDPPRHPVFWVVGLGRVVFVCCFAFLLPFLPFCNGNKLVKPYNCLQSIGHVKQNLTDHNTQEVKMNAI